MDKKIKSMKRLVKNRKPKRWLEKQIIWAREEYIKFKGIVIQLEPDFWNNTYCYVDLKNDENYINLNEDKKVTRFCVNDFYFVK